MTKGDGVARGGRATGQDDGVAGVPDDAALRKPDDGALRAPDDAAGREGRPSGGGQDLAWVAWLRVLAIAAVVVLHTTGATAIDPTRAATPEGLLASVLHRGGIFAVPVFVMASGALLLDPARYRGDADFLRRRALRLVPAIVFWLLFYWAFKVLVLGEEVTARTALVAAINGRLSTGLYFFWIVLGLALVTPVLVPWVARSSRRAVGVAAAVAASIPLLGFMTAPLRGTGMSVVESAWTWWIPYLGLYLAGRALAHVVPRGRWLVLWTAVSLGCWTLLVVAQRATELPPGWDVVVGGYYSPVGHLFGVAVFLTVRGFVDQRGPLRVLTRPRAARLGRRLGDVTLGVFAVHIAVLEVSYRLPGLAGDPVAQTLTELLGRAAFVLLVAYVLALLMRQVPGVRRLV